MLCINFIIKIYQCSLRECFQFFTSYSVNLSNNAILFIKKTIILIISNELENKLDLKCIIKSVSKEEFIKDHKLSLYL